MLSEGVALVEGLSQQYKIPILLTRSASDGFSQAVWNVANGVIQCELTSQEPRFTGERFETFVYPGNGFTQTTFAYWNRALSQRHSTADWLSSQPEVPAVGAG